MLKYQNFRQFVFLEF